MGMMLLSLSRWFFSRTVCKDNAFFVNYKKQIRIRLIFLIPV